ncbi:hypothetical protein JHK87_052894 [Glycine soja]|nr:hypothetical protein JHK87_052894 [Glycine soja]
MSGSGSNSSGGDTTASGSSSVARWESGIGSNIDLVGRSLTDPTLDAFDIDNLVLNDNVGDHFSTEEELEDDGDEDDGGGDQCYGYGSPFLLMISFYVAKQPFLKCCLQDTMKIFCDMSGQEISKEKTRIYFSKNVVEHSKRALVKLSGYTEAFLKCCLWKLSGSASVRTES